MSNLDKIVKIINKVADLLDDKPKQPAQPLTEYGESIVFNKIICIIEKHEDICLNRFNQVDQSKDYYLKWEGALFIIREIKKEITNWFNLVFGKEETSDEWD